MIGTFSTVSCERNTKIKVRTVPGHFAMTYSHSNAFVDSMEVKLNQRMAMEAASILADAYAYEQQIDTIVTMDGTEVLGGFVAMDLARKDMYSVNQDTDMHVVSPELEHSAQMIFRDNLQPLIKGKRTLILCGSLLTGNKVRKAIECVQWYGGTVVGIAAVFSIHDVLDGIPVRCLFSAKEFPEFQNWEAGDCPFCRAGQRVDALANCYGYSKV